MEKKKAIIDFGLHTAQDALMYLKQGYYVFGVDADLRSIEKARTKLDIENSTLINVGVSDTDSDSLNFFVNNTNSEWSSFAECGKIGGDYNIVKVPVVSVLTFFEKYINTNIYDIEYVKIDIEGYDEKALRSLMQTKCRPKYISVENGNGNLLDILKGAGYSSFSYVQQNDNWNKQVEITHIDGHVFNYTLGEGASGPFGHDLKSAWKSADDILLDIRRVWNEDGTKKSTHNDDVDGWFDLHAKL